MVYTDPFSEESMRRHLLILLLSVLPVFAQSKHPFTFDDMMSLKRVGEPIVSPDGKWVLFSAVDVELATNKKTPHIWVVPTAGGESRVVIAGQDADRPRWSPVGNQFLFLSNKEGGSQIWIADFDGAAGAVSGMHKLTSIATEADGPIWSPDGKNILFVSNVYPECGDEACNEKKVKESADSKVKAMIFTHLLYRHWNGYKESKRSHLLIIPAAGGAAHDLTPGDFDVPPFSLGGQDDYAFSPDGQEVCYTSNHDEVGATSTNNDLFIVPVGGGGAKNITAENKASDSTPQYTPDGKYIAYRAQTRPGYESDRFRLMLYNRRTGYKRSMTEDFDQWVGTYTIAPDSSKIYFTSEHEGQAPMYSLDLTSLVINEETGTDALHRTNKGIKQVLDGFNDDLTMTHDGKIVLLTRMSIKAPNEIYRYTLGGAPTGTPAVADASKPAFPTQEVCTDENGKLKPGGCKPAPVENASLTQLTHLNDAVLGKVLMAPLEPFWFTGAENAKVEGFLLKPPDFDGRKKYPVKFLIHGGPQGAWGDDWSFRWNPELFAANGYVVVTVNFHGSTGYGQKFIDAINGDWGGRPFVDLMKGLDYAEQEYKFIDKDRECALGASYGGYAINWILGHSNRFKCLVSHDGMFNTESAWGTTEELWFSEWEFKGTPYNNRELYRKWSPHLSATNFKTPTLVVHGQLDYRLDVSEGFQLFTTLQRVGVPSKMLYFPDEGHWVLKPQNSQLWYKTVNDWVDQWTKK
jgi:dipeptidyl aminopeptidase/acylaminoacyl peptidase